MPLSVWIPTQCIQTQAEKQGDQLWNPGTSLIFGRLLPLWSNTGAQYPGFCRSPRRRTPEWGHGVSRVCYTGIVTAGLCPAGGTRKEPNGPWTGWPCAPFQRTALCCYFTPAFLPCSESSMTVVTLSRRGIALQTGKNYEVQQYQVLKTGINKNSAQHGITITLSSSVSETPLWWVSGTHTECIFLSFCQMLV